MTANQYRDALSRLGFTQAGAAEFLGIDARTSRHWALGESRIPEATAKLLRLMIRLKLTPDDVK